ncbi:MULTISPECIES: hypothetical protein [Pseudomonas]|jgi:hypothetical protein|uniref:Uncharacterized protein n=1 Tax=Pseudomonas fluorescens TaxID=294 RepID=A0A5E6XUC0_PSEFL|nr:MULTISPECIES: hypothetical protein [Pseudomonas]VVN44039.1 hypothetical protein PS655_05654 [Pseudomonas fluorescens]
MNDLSNMAEPPNTRNGDLVDLTAHQRNLLLLRPILRLDINKSMHRGDDDSKVLEGLDTNYLCLASLFYMMEGAAINQGYTLTEVRDHLMVTAGSMRAELSEPARLRVAEVVLDTLSNATNKYAAHRESYFHAPSGETKEFTFKLVRLEQDHEGTVRFTPTEQGYVVLMGMLDLEIEDYQVLIEKMLVHLIENGRFEQALELANRARLLSIEHRQMIREMIRQANRSPGTVNWRKDISPRLSEARHHVSERQSVDHHMMESLATKIRGMDNPNAIAPLAKLNLQLQRANLQRLNLLNDIGGAGDRFLQGQALGFRARRRSGLPDIDLQLLPALMEKPLSAISSVTEDLLLSFYPAVPPKIFDLSTLLDALLERRDAYVYEGDEEEVDGEIAEFVQIPNPFSTEVIATALAWLDVKMHSGQTWHLGQLIELAEREGLSFVERKAVAYELYRAYADSESRYPHLHAHVSGEFETSVVSGDDLKYVIKQESSNEQQ